MKIDPKRICWVAPVVDDRARRRGRGTATPDRSRRRARCRSPGPGPRTRAHTDASMAPAPATAPTTNPRSGSSPTSNAPDPPAVDDVGEGVAGEGLPPHDGEDPDHGGDHRALRSADHEGDVDLVAGEKARLEEPAAASDSPRSAECSRRAPRCRLPTDHQDAAVEPHTSTWWPYSALSTSLRTTSSVVPLAARPSAR